MRGYRKLYLGSDHAGFNTKEKIKDYLDSKKIDYEDLSPKKLEGDDYPEIAFKVSKKLSKTDRAILVCGTGTGMAIAANRIKGVRAVAAYDNYSAKMSRLDNDSNILGLGARNLKIEKLKKIILVWLSTKFSNKYRHKRRIKKLDR